MKSERSWNDSELVCVWCGSSNIKECKIKDKGGNWSRVFDGCNEMPCGWRGNAITRGQWRDMQLCCSCKWHEGKCITPCRDHCKKMIHPLLVTKDELIAVYEMTNEKLRNRPTGSTAHAVHVNLNAQSLKIMSEILEGNTCSKK